MGSYPILNHLPAASLHLVDGLHPPAHGGGKEEGFARAKLKLSIYMYCVLSVKLPPGEILNMLRLVDI